MEATGLVVANEELHRRFPDPSTQLRFSWWRRAFLETHEGFIRQGIGYDVAMVSLDLMLVYLEEGQASEILRLADETATLFEAQEVHREALAALRLLLEAARREEINAALIRDVAKRLSEAS